ncbi:LysE family transporter [Clostridium sp. D2Q-11]|uniref:LysE family transporter n=1 Tax=Anaeromonas frigoriresistens TaxID=2683708 RepID=A0A942Z924_9FIRM|nr:LysE family transporter [Anaeromonas frigoriresistens]MBS4538644.1 LysE family transporter [Anaeromonas frigoriresistens]
MIKYFMEGFALGLAYVAPIGMQNIYVINTAISRGKIKAYQVAFITSFFDITLALASFFGMGALMVKYELLRMIVLLLGSVMVTYIGVGLIRSKPNMENKVDVNKTLYQVIIACFMVTWINPQAIIDGTLLLGGFRASLPESASVIFIIGVAVASLSWFIGLTTVVSIFRKSFNYKVIRWINIVCGSVIIYYGLKLGYSFVKII